MDIKRAIITAAGKSQRTLPLQTLVDRDGQTKTALAIIIEEVLAAGIEELCVVDQMSRGRLDMGFGRGSSLFSAASASTV